MLFRSNLRISAVILRLFENGIIRRPNKYAYEIVPEHSPYIRDLLDNVTFRKLPAKKKEEVHRPFPNINPVKKPRQKTA